MYISRIGDARYSEVGPGLLEYADQERIFTQSCNGMLTFKYNDIHALRIDVLVLWIR